MLFNGKTVLLSTDTFYNVIQTIIFVNEIIDFL